MRIFKPDTHGPPHLAQCSCRPHKCHRISSREAVFDCQPNSSFKSVLIQCHRRYVFCV